MSESEKLPDFSALSEADQIKLLTLLRIQANHISGRQIDTFFPDSGEHRRELYPKHLEFFAAGAEFRERCFMAANRIGKTIAGGAECTYHLTGQYPHWWVGKRFDHPVKYWVSGKTNETTRDIVQTKLFGEVLGGGSDKRFSGTGLVPRESIIDASWKHGIHDLADKIQVRHISGGISICGIKSYQQTRSAFEGTEQHGIWLDEEPPEDIYNECLIRTATTKGIIAITFTPLEGMSSVVMSFLPQEQQLATD